MSGVTTTFVNNVLNLVDALVEQYCEHEVLTKAYKKLQNNRKTISKRTCEKLRFVKLKTQRRVLCAILEWSRFYS